VLRSELALGPSDVVVSVGGGWNYPGNGPTCRRLRERLGFRSVHIIYDLIPVKFPQLFRTGFADMIDGWLYETFQSADLLLTISRHTRRDVLEHCARRRLTAPPIEVVRLGELISPGGAADTPPANDSFDTSQPFVLSVGTLEIRKNHLLLYHVWRRLLEQHGPTIPRLVLVGSLGWLTAEVLHQIRQDPLTREHIVVITHCDDEQLRSLYQHCLFTMYPSHYEGWGLPIAESLALGKYCIASNTSSMPEIGGDLVGMHDPCDVLGCLRLVTEALDPDFRAAREERIRRHYRRTSWDETAGQLLSQIDRHFGSTVAPPSDVVARSA
jgi:glycosyltransferase involved in cell wall biosynthesis